MQKLKQFITIIGGMNRGLGRISSFVLMLIMLFLCYEVVMRYFFNSPTIWVHELSGFSFAFYLALTGPWLLERKEHVSVDIVYSKFSPRFRLTADIIAYLVCLIFLWSFSGWEEKICCMHSRSISIPTRSGVRPWGR